MTTDKVIGKTRSPIAVASGLAGRSDSVHERSRARLKQVTLRADD